MGKPNPVFQQNYESYLRQLNDIDLSLCKSILSKAKGESTRWKNAPATTHRNGDSTPFSKSSATIAAHQLSFSKTKSQEFVRNARKRSRIIGKITGVSYGARHLHLFREIYVQNLSVQKIAFTGTFNFFDEVTRGADQW